MSMTRARHVVVRDASPGPAPFGAAFPDLRCRLKTGRRCHAHAEVVQGGWPPLLDLPTGSGKTCVLDIALYSMAVAPERSPRRTFLVVDRRIVVDQGAIHARKILGRLRVGAAPAIESKMPSNSWGRKHSQ